VESWTAWIVFFDPANTNFASDAGTLRAEGMAAEAEEPSPVDAVASAYWYFVEGVLDNTRHWVGSCIPSERLAAGVLAGSAEHGFAGLNWNSAGDYAFLSGVVILVWVEESTTVTKTRRWALEAMALVSLG